MTEVARFYGPHAEVVVEERETSFVVIIETPSGAWTRVGAPYRSKFRAIQAAQRLAGSDS